MSRNKSTETLESALLRLVDENGWDWRTVAKVLNRYYETEYSISELKAMYKTLKSNAKFL